MKCGLRKIAILLFVFAMAVSVIVFTPLSGYSTTVEAASSKTISISSKKVTTTKNAPFTLTMSGLGKKDVVSWSISPKSYGKITVSKDTKSCKVTASKTGATVTAKVNGKKYSCKVTVVAAKMSKDTLSLKKGKNDVISLSGTSTAAKWSVDNKKVATIKKVGKNKYRVVAVGKGTTYVRAKIGSKTYKTKVTVTVPTALSKTSISIKYGSTYTLKLNNASGKTVWSVDEEASDIVTIKTSGKKNTGASCTVTPRLVGSTYVYAVCKGKTYRCKVTVKAISSPKLNKKKLTLSPKETYKLTVSGQKLKEDVKWSTSNKKVAAVSKAGKVTAKGVGSCVVSATVEGVVLTCNVVVAKADSTDTKADSTDTKVSTGTTGDDAASKLKYSYDVKSGTINYTWNSTTETMDNNLATLEGGEFTTYTVKVEDSAALENIEFVLENDNAEITGTYEGTYDSGKKYKSVEVYGRLKGKDTLKIYCEGVLMKECKIVVTSNDTEYFGYVNWRKNIIEPEIWKDCKTDEDKVYAAALYAMRHEYSTHSASDDRANGGSGRFPFYNMGSGNGTGDCITGAGFVVDCAKDLGLTAYVGDGSMMGTSAHKVAYVYINGKLNLVEATPMINRPN